MVSNFYSGEYRPTAVSSIRTCRFQVFDRFPDKPDAVKWNFTGADRLDEHSHSDRMVCSRTTRLRADERMNLWEGIGHTMLSGFNTNFRYRGVLFHVQTEDSGRENPHVITHLFHGGNIIASEKQEYSKLLGEDDIEGAVKKMMEGQHKAILMQLSRGEHDLAIGERLGPDVFRAESETGTDSANSPAVTEEEQPPAAARSRKKTPIASAMAEVTVLSEDPESPPSPPDSTSGLSRVFGERVVSEKPLDEVVLDYLVENARKRRRQPK